MVWREGGVKVGVGDGRTDYHDGEVPSILIDNLMPLEEV
jgi:hypothetical protein